MSRRPTCIACRRVAATCAVLAVPLSACTSSPPPATAAGPEPVQRQKLSFNLDWKYQQGDTAGAELAAFDDSGWGYVDLPHTTRFVTPEHPNAYLGVSWYRKHFALPTAYHDGKVSIEFEAAMQAADVWVNDAHLTRHEGGYTPFSIDVTDHVVYGGGDNVIAVKLDSNANAAWAPGWNGVDFQYHGGLYRNVNLLVTDRLHVTDAVYANKVAGGGIFVRYPAVDAGAATLAVTTNVLNESAQARSVSLLSEIVDDAGNVVASASDSASIDTGLDHDFEQTITLQNPALWHPYTPRLYTLQSTLQQGGVAVDELETRIGIRRIEWTHDGGLAINGERFAALGVNLHQEAYGLGNAVPDQAIFYDVKRIKDGGLNFIRGSHYPHAPAFYDACDALGVLVLDAQTGWQFYSNTQTFRDHTFQELRDMLRRDRNHPSVVAWEASLNESNYTDDWAASAHAIVHEEYPGDQAYSAQWIGSRADIFADASQHAVRSSATARPIIIDEYGDWDYGGAASTSRQAREAGDGAQLVQAANIEDGTSKNLALSWFSAGSYWDYADYAGFSNFGITRSGLVDMYRLPKFAYYFLQSQRDPSIVIPGVDSGPMLFIANYWTPSSPLSVRVYGNCEQVSLYLDDTLVDTRSPDTGTSLLHPPFHFDFDGFSPGTLRADCLIGGSVATSFTRRTPEAASAVLLQPEASTLRADASDARLVFISVVDANGSVVPDDASEVTLAVSGPGALVGPSTVTMKGGALAAWVKSTREPGTITLSATAADLTAGSVDLTSEAVPDLPPLPADRQ